MRELGIEDLAKHADLGRALQPDQAGEEEERVLGDDPALDEVDRKIGALTNDSEVCGEDQIASGAPGRAVDRRDHRLQHVASDRRVDS